MRLEGPAVAAFIAGDNSVRDGRLRGLAIRQGANPWDDVLVLTFEVPAGTEGSHYSLELSGELSFDYGFDSENTLSEIAMAKCLWTDDGYFFLSLDPWKESERFISEQDNNVFKCRTVLLTVTREAAQST